MNKLDCMKAFISVVEQGSFTAAADKLDLSPQLISKYVSALERELSLQLLQRTTRRVSVTEVGRAYCDRARQILLELEELEQSVQDESSKPRGVLRISAPMSFSTLHLGEALASFQKQFPDVLIDIQLSDRKVDIIEEGFDLALRIGRLSSSSFIARKIAPIRLVTCASPDYLKKYGTPETPSDLSRHHYLHYSYRDSSEPLVSGSTRAFPYLKGNHYISANNGEVLANAAIAGAGIIVQPTFIVGPAIAAGKLSVILSDNEPEPLGLYALYAHRRYLSHKVRSFIDFLGNYFGDPPYWDAL
ncbi:LysR family transcriptional regulator [Kangiella sediminilitoris]|uniref:Transcriptional regulator, LysR family n=1 Tax=Kangiella sediminilitoris TaxID=1144748 RepID=A0A1B3B9M2_9GAMM|nr:LysR family transcriptional regulator [Kangiella sediminilitoris]AOE49456.1 Transcriptional regulator, LysR family [Kangiella sediminilitoris]